MARPAAHCCGPDRISSLTDTKNHAASTPPGPWWDRVAFGGLLLALVWAPLPLGSNRPWAVGVLASLLCLLVALYLLGAVHGGHARFRGRLLAAAWSLGLMGCFALLLLGQLSAPAWLQAPLHTMDAFQTRIYLLTTLAYLAAALLVALCVGTARRVTLLLVAVLAAGVLQAVIAVALYSAGASYQYLFTDFAQGGRVTGTFVNPDHLAGYLELCLSAGLGLMLAQFGGGQQQVRGWRQKVVSALTFMLSAKMLLRLMLVVMVVALVMTHSRMGNGAFFLALLLVGGLVAVVSRRLRRPALWLVASMALVDLVIIGQWVGLDRVVERLQDTAESSVLDASAPTAPGIISSTALGVIAPLHREDSIQERLRVPVLSLPLVAQQPWFGHGGGTYFLSLPAIKPAGFPHLWDHAHNDYVEVAVDTGWVGLALLLALATATAWRALRMLSDSAPRLNRGVGAAALTALSCMGLHSLVDFNLQIPANAITLVVLLALVWITPMSATLPAGAAAPRRR